MNKLSEHMAFALELATVAANEILPRFQLCDTKIKDDGSLVTEADQAAERAMRSLIAERYPSHSVLGEEEGETDGNAAQQWIIDPIDGTSSFALGIPMFGTLIGLFEDGSPQLGVIHLPVTGENLYAENGSGCWYVRGNRQRQQVRVDSSVTTLSSALVSLSGFSETELRSGKQKDCFDAFLNKSNSVTFVGDCIQHLLVAHGRLHIAFDTLMHPWDSAAIIPCIREAGGVVSTLDGDYNHIAFGGSLLSSCSLSLHEEVLQIFSKYI